MNRDWFYVWFVPLLWCGFTVVSSFHTGDEHGLFFLGSIAGVWPFLFLRVFGSIKGGLWLILLVGALTMAVPGVLLDLLRVRKRFWVALLVVLFVLFFVLQYFEYGSFERMRRKQGYVAAVVVATCNWSIYGASVLCIVGGFFRFLFRCVRPKKVASGPEDLADGRDGATLR